MQENVYQELARRLDDLPNGFPATESGVELRLLAKLFTPEEARLKLVSRQPPLAPKALKDTQISALRRAPAIPCATLPSCKFCSRPGCASASARH